MNGRAEIRPPLCTRYLISIGASAVSRSIFAPATFWRNARTSPAKRRLKSASTAFAAASAWSR